MAKNSTNDSMQQKMNKQQSGKDIEKTAGFGDKKLEGPNKPSV